MGSSSGLLRRRLRIITPPMLRGSPRTHRCMSRNGRLALATEPRHPTEDHSTLKQPAAAASIVARTIPAAMRLSPCMASGSLALISEGNHNPIDIGASALSLFPVREAANPADSDHPFGHAKIEAV